MKSKIWLLIIIWALIPSCGEKMEQEVAETWPEGQPKKVFFYDASTGQRQKVKEVRFFESGKKEMEGHYKNGKKQGTWTFWIENGKRQSENNFNNDLRDGKATVWRENGYKYYEGTYSMGKLHGTWIFYDMDGRRLKEVIFEHDVKIREAEFQLPLN